MMNAPPVNTIDWYLAGNPDGIEEVSEYRTGGLHPVHLGDCFGSDNRYRVLLKLGYGGFSTVWLCRDTKDPPKYVAMKIHRASIAAGNLLDPHLSKLDLSFPGGKYISIPRDHFSHNGPNGTHQCLISDVLGPKITPVLWMHLDDPGPKLRGMCLQAALAMHFLHHNRICHGDFRCSNILLRAKDFDHLSEEDVDKMLGTPEIVEIKTESGGPLPAFLPRYVVVPQQMMQLGLNGHKFLTDEICVVNFGQSYPFASPPRYLGIPEEYLPPEVVLGAPSSIGVSCDLWALACTLYEIRFQLPFFYMLRNEDELLTKMVNLFGKLPEPLWSNWRGRSGYFTETGKRLERNVIGRTKHQAITLDVMFRTKREMRLRGGGSRYLSFPEREVPLCEDLLLKLFKYAPGKRMKAADVVEHEWFKFVET